jgi:hypothetical protein
VDAEVAWAIIAGAVIGALYFHYREYHYWWTWIRRGAIVALLGYVILSGLAGLLGWWIGLLTHWHPTSNALANGIAFGAAGQVVVRARSPFTGKEDFEGTRSILSLATHWMTEVLDTRTGNAIKSWAQFLPFQELKQRAWDGYNDYMRDDDGVLEATKKEHVANLRTSITLLDDVEDNKVIEGRSDLKATVSKTCEKYRVPKPGS